jgi:hypothetical protein
VMTFAVSGHRRRLRRMVHGAALLLWAIGELALLPDWAGFLHDPPLIVFVVWTLMGAAILWNSGRRGAGRETLTVTPMDLVTRRAIGPFQIRRSYDLSRISRVTIARLAAPAPERFRIEFKYDGRIRRFGHNLTAPEAACILKMIRRALTPLARPS